MLYQHIVFFALGMYQYIGAPPVFGRTPPPTKDWFPFSPFTTHVIRGERCTSAHVPRCRFTDAYLIHVQNQTVEETWFRVRATVNDPIREFEATPSACRAHAVQLNAIVYRFRLATQRCELYARWEINETAHPRFEFVYDYTHALSVEDRRDVVRRAVVANDCLLNTFDCDDP